MTKQDEAITAAAELAELDPERFRLIARLAYVLVKAKEPHSDEAEKVLETLVSRLNDEGRLITECVDELSQVERLLQIEPD